MAGRLNQPAPLVIGGTGGSGTRLIAQLCSNVGYHLSPPLNDALDTLAFFDFYERWLTPYLSGILDPTQQQTLRSELRALVDALYAAIPPARRRRWGWKTPRSLLLLPALDTCIEGLRFIHVVRDGRDMAYSANQNQLRKHGAALLSPVQRAQPEPLQALAFWEISNLRAAEYGTAHLRGRYLWVRYEDVVANDATTLNALADFLEAPSAERARLWGQAGSGATIGRWCQRPEAERRLLAASGATGLGFFGYL